MRLSGELVLVAARFAPPRVPLYELVSFLGFSYGRVLDQSFAGRQYRQQYEQEATLRRKARVARPFWPKQVMLSRSWLWASGCGLRALLATQVLHILRQPVQHRHPNRIFGGLLLVAAVALASYRN